MKYCRFFLLGVGVEGHVYKLSQFSVNIFFTGEQNERPEARELIFLQSDLGANFLRQCAVMGPNPVKGLFFAQGKLV